MYQKYPHLLSPIKVGATIFRNRISSAPMTLHALQGSEPYPTDAVITHYANKARGLVFADKDGKEQAIEAGTVLIAVGMRPKQAEAEAFRKAAGRYAAIGDCVKAADVEKAMYSAFDTAVQL